MTSFVMVFLKKRLQAALIVGKMAVGPKPVRVPSNSNTTNNLNKGVPNTSDLALYLLHKRAG